MHLCLSVITLPPSPPPPPYTHTNTHAQKSASASSMNEDYIRKQAKIYGKNSARNLSRYEQRINEASVHLCLKSPDLLNDRSLLFKEARRVVDEEGYDYKKGRSRSRSLNPQADVSSDPPKKKKMSEHYRVTRIAELQERIKDITDQIGYKEKRRESASLVHNYKECDQITEQMSELKCERRKLEIELAGLTKKQKKSKWYHTTKKSSRSKSLPGSSSDSTQKTLTFSHPSSSCSSSHSVSPSPLSYTSSGNSSPHNPLSPTSEAESISDVMVLSSEDDQQGSLVVGNEPESESSHHTSTEMLNTAAKGESSQSF